MGGGISKIDRYVDKLSSLFFNLGISLRRVTLLLTKNIYSTFCVVSLFFPLCPNRFYILPLMEAIENLKKSTAKGVNDDDAGASI